MSENDQTPSPSKQTASIPLKKETVRVTLKAADAPPASPSSVVPTAPPVRPPTPTAPPVPTAAPAAPTAPIAGGAPRPAPAATIPLKTAGAPIPRPAPTIALKPGPSAPTTPGTRPALPGSPGGSTISLPKATVQLQPPSPSLGIPSQRVATLSAEDEDDGEESSLPGILSIFACIAAMVVLYFQATLAQTWIDVDDNAKKGDWSQLFD